MKVLIDADACPVVSLAISVCNAYKIPCILLCDTAHEIKREGAQTYVIDKGSDSVDFALVNRVCAGDIVVTQDYGLAAMCLPKAGAVLHQDGWQYTSENIEALLFQRHAAKKARMAGKRWKGPSKREPTQDKAFQAALEKQIQQSLQG